MAIYSVYRFHFVNESQYRTGLAAVPPFLPLLQPTNGELMSRVIGIWKVKRRRRHGGQGNNSPASVANWQWLLSC
jgi:hypothetical protein